MFDLLIATNNDHKIHEYEEMLSVYGIKVHSPKEFGINDNPIEDGKTFKENSLIKAKSLQRFSKMPLIADDSGLCVTALDNFPGIYSARFAKECGGNINANLEIIKRLKDKKDKSAHFSCVITLLNVEETPVVLEGICEGSILDKPDGIGGFGYDPIFYSNEAKMSFGSAPEEIKNKYSHRSKAVKLLITYLKKKKLID